MKTVLISECSDYNIPHTALLDLSTIKVKGCTGCWTCWWKTPGKCIQHDLDDFYRSYLNSDKAIFIAKLENGFISGNMKSLFDRMIPHFLPYCAFANGGTMHMPRYKKYPDIEFYYDYQFENQDVYNIFFDYINKVFTQFYSKNILIKNVSDFNTRRERNENNNLERLAQR